MIGGPDASAFRPLEIPDRLAVAGSLTVKVFRARARHVEHQSKISRFFASGLCGGCSFSFDMGGMSISWTRRIAPSTISMRQPYSFATRAARASSACVKRAGRLLTRVPFRLRL